MSPFVFDDYVVMRTTVLSPLLSSAMSRLVPMFFAPGLDEDDVRAARDAWRDVLSPGPARQEVLAERALRRSLFGPIGYGGIPLQRGEIEAEADARVREFRTAALSLRHVRVVAVGDVTPDGFAQMLEQYMPPVSPSTESSTSSCAALPVPPRDGDVHVIDDPGAVQSRVHIGAVGVPAGHPDGEALEVVSAVLGDSVASRLGLKIREEHGYTYGVTMRSHQWRAHGLVDIVTSVDSGRTVEAIQGLLAELDRAATEPFDPSELAAAKPGTRAFGGAHWMAARELEKIAAYDLPSDEPVRASERRAKLTAEDLRRVTAKYLARPQRVITVVGDASKIVPALRQAGIGHVVLAAGQPWLF
jgi:zinc protease